MTEWIITETCKYVVEAETEVIALAKFLDNAPNAGNPMVLEFIGVYDRTAIKIQDDEES